MGCRASGCGAKGWGGRELGHLGSLPAPREGCLEANLQEAAPAPTPHKPFHPAVPGKLPAGVLALGCDLNIGSLVLRGAGTSFLSPLVSIGVPCQCLGGLV